MAKMKLADAVVYSKNKLKGPSLQRTFTGGSLLQIAMPLGGIGAGCVCLNGLGGVQDFSIRNRPATSALPDGHHPTDAAFAMLHVRGKNPQTKLIEGPFPIEKIYNLGLKSNGLREGGSEGLPRFAKCAFTGEYPFGYVDLSDPEIPLEVRITGFNPFIPQDDINSSLPAAILEYEFINKTSRTVEFDFAYSMSNWAAGGISGEKFNWRNSPIGNDGILFANDAPKKSPNFATAALVALSDKPKIKASWFRGGWFDGITALWREFSSGKFESISRTVAGKASQRGGGSICFSAKVKPGVTQKFAIAMIWHWPNSDVAFPVDNAKKKCSAANCSCNNSWRPFYAGKWPNAASVAKYLRKNYADLRRRTIAFKNALFSSTMPSYVLDAVSANLAILKSPTVLRQENGNVWAWEGCFCGEGCCAGSCTHVWNYAQASPHLFPKLERTLRNQELINSMNEAGHVDFRAALPDGKTGHTFYAAADGQLGGIMKLYRDWRISGDAKWMKSLYPRAKASIEYSIRTWDPDEIGALINPHHNTYDVEFYGPDGMCMTIYIGALSAMAELARGLRRDGDAKRYSMLADKATKYLDGKLFNGEYYFQNVMHENDGAKKKNTPDWHSGGLDCAGADEARLLQREGPKYQYGRGCLSDGVIGAWMAQLYGIPTPMDQVRIRKNLRAIFRNNFRATLVDHACTQRPGYAIADDAGLLLCTWPDGGKLMLPFPYSDEVWTGIEYQVASHMIMNGLVNEGLTIVAAVRARHDGRRRNPWNEYECGSYYARAMASYALLQACSGFRYSPINGVLHLSPKLGDGEFRSFFSTAGGFGVVSLTGRTMSVEIVEGQLDLRGVCVEIGGNIFEKKINTIVKPKRPAKIRLG